MFSKYLVILLVFLGLWLVVEAALIAQDETGDPAKKEEKEEDPAGQAEIPDLKKVTQRIRNEAIRYPDLADPLLLIEIYRDSFRFWPRSKEGQDAVAQVLKGGKGTIPILEKMLEERDYRLKPAVAYLLGKLGHVEALDRIEALLDDPRLKRSVRYILGALYRLDPEHTEKLCIELLAGKQSAFRIAAYSILNTRATAEKIDEQTEGALRGLLSCEIGDIRLKAFLLLKKYPNESLDQAALDHVGDPFPKMAKEVTRYLAVRNVPGVIEGLKGKITFEHTRTFAFALVTLTLLENQFEEVLLPPDAGPALEPFIFSRDPVLSVSAAAALCNIALRSGTEADINLVRNKIVPSLMQVFLSNTYFKDFACMLEVAAKTLSKATGLPFKRDLVLWREWWNKEGLQFSRSQFLISIDPKDYPCTVIRYDPLPVKNRNPFVLAGEKLLGDPAFDKDGFCFFLSEEAMGDLIEFFYARGFFRRQSKNPAVESGLSSVRGIGMRVRDHSRFMEPEDGEDELFKALEERLTEIYEANLWQILYPGGDLSKWWEHRYAWWKTEGKEKEKTDRFLGDLIAGFGQLEDEVILSCMDWLAARENISKSLTQETVLSLLDKMNARFRIDAVVKGLVGLVMVGGDKDTVRSLARHLYGTYGEAAFPVLGEMILATGDVEEFLADDRWYVRTIAAEVAYKVGGRLVPRLKALLLDERPEVRRAAIRSLAAIGDEESRKALSGIMDAGDLDARETLIEALGRQQGAWVLAYYGRVLAGDNPRLWNIAIEGISTHRTLEGANLIKDFIHRFDMASDQARIGLDALQRMGGEPARETLFVIIEECKDPAAAKQIALSLTVLGDTRVFPRLEDCLFERDLRQRAIDAMAFLLVADFGQDYIQYKTLWERFPGESQAFFLRNALRLGVIEKGGETAYEGVPASILVKALSDDAWPVRLAALRILEEGTGLSFGKLEKTSDEETIDTVAGAWENGSPVCGSGVESGRHAVFFRKEWDGAS